MDTAVADSLPYGQEEVEEVEDDSNNNNSGSGSGDSGNDIVGSMHTTSLGAPAAIKEGAVGDDGGIGNSNGSTTMAPTTIESAAAVVAAAAGDKGNNTKAAVEVDERLRKMAPVPNIPYHLQVITNT